MWFKTTHKIILILQAVVYTVVCCVTHLHMLCYVTKNESYEKHRIESPKQLTVLKAKRLYM